MSSLTVSLVGVLKNAAYCIDGLAGQILLMEDRFKDPNEDNVDEDPECFYRYQPNSNTFMLREVVKHIGELREGKHTVAQFVEFYNLKPTAEDKPIINGQPPSWYTEDIDDQIANAIDRMGKDTSSVFPTESRFLAFIELLGIKIPKHTATKV
jgi:hypothetical protein